MSDHNIQLGLGIVGLGRATMSMLHSILSHSQINIIAVAEINQTAREAFSRDYQVNAYQNVEDLCNDPKVDIVYIATPHQLHAKHSVICAAHKKHIILEKPMALTLKECDEINQAVKQNSVKLVIGHTHSFDAPMLKMEEIIKSGKLGRLGMIHTWNYTDFLYRPRRPEELDTHQGGGIIFNQIPHQVDIIRLLGGGLVKSVRAKTGIWDRSRFTEGAVTAYLEFENDVVATIIYSAYDHFDSNELHYDIRENGQKKKPDNYGKRRRILKSLKGMEEEMELKKSTGYAGRRSILKDEEHFHPHFGILIASCEKGDIKQSHKGLIIYGDEEKEELDLPVGPALPDKSKVLDEIVNSIINDNEPLHNGMWGAATLEVCLAMLESSRKRQEVFLTRQVKPL